ncbi:hypothetical protein [Halobacterium sp. R2-5]|uniref:hypothetical protein n=1 Tax=Halobacterium sp. R2-5 TaxID=2715751 RepID=UPI00142127A2|nr:hypothetical protein [Halobacterium sp. R2-5]NIB99314.1 hypothetical protein [Halobacterium sp. R2-5]
MPHRQTASAAAPPVFTDCLTDDDGTHTSTELVSRAVANLTFVDVANAGLAVTAGIIGESTPISGTVDVPADDHRDILSRIDEPEGSSFDVFVEKAPVEPRVVSARRVQVQHEVERPRDGPRRRTRRPYRRVPGASTSDERRDDGSSISG